MLRNTYQQNRTLNGNTSFEEIKLAAIRKPEIVSSRERVNQRHLCGVHKLTLQRVEVELTK